MEFREFHRVFYARVRNFVAAMRVRSGDVNDVVQEVFVTAHLRRGTVEHPAAMTSWLYETARNHVMNYRRRVWIGRVDLCDDADETEETVVTGGRRGLEYARLQLISLMQVVEQLEPRERQAWGHRYFDDLTLPEVAELCGCSLAEVKRRISRAESAVDGAVEETSP